MAYVYFVMTLSARKTTVNNFIFSLKQSVINRRILKCAINEYSKRGWTVLIWPRIGYYGILLCCVKKVSVATKGENFFFLVSVC